MKAIVFQNYGQPDQLKLKDVKKPSANDNEVLIKVHAVSVNDWDWGMLRGVPFANRVMAGLFAPSKISILGCDIAGSIETIGKNIKNFQVGDNVFGDLSNHGFGGFSEYVCAPENALTLKPASMSFEQASAIPQASLLALQSLKNKIQPKQKVLINGGGGGAGTFAIQIAKTFAAEITAVDSTEKLDVMRSIGADHVIDYKEDFTKQGLCYDLIIDMVASHSVFDYKRTLNSGGTYIAIGGPTGRLLQILCIGSMVSLFSSKKMKILLHKANHDIDSIIIYFESGQVIPVIDKRYPLSETADALKYFGEGHTKGKLVITI